jgi:hypothetical protein
LKTNSLFEVGFRFGKPKPFANKGFLRGLKTGFHKSIFGKHHLEEAAFL